MISGILILFSMLLLGLGVWGIQREFRQHPFLIASGEFSRSAQRVGRSYRILAWMVLTGMVLASLVSSFATFLMDINIL